MVVGLSTRRVPVFTPVPETSTAIWLPKLAPVIVTVVLPPRRMVDGVTEVIFGPRTTERQPLHVPCLPSPLVTVTFRAPVSAAGSTVTASVSWVAVHPVTEALTPAPENATCLRFRRLAR